MASMTPQHAEEVLLRPAVAADWPRIWPFWQQIVDEGRTYPWSPGTDEATARELWMLEPPAETWVIERRTPHGQSTVVASAFLEPNQPGTGSHVAHCGFMVDAAERGKGYGRLLVTGMLRRATEVGYRAMQFNAVVADNPAIALYQDLGFHVVGRVPEGLSRPDGSYVDILILHRFLSP